MFLKQYGERRTGTNYIRALLLANCPGTVVLMHVLGDKHSPPVALDEYWQWARTHPDAAFEFVKAATFAAPAESTRKADGAQLEYIRRVAEPLAQSVGDGRLGFVISVKHPYPWAASFAKYSGWLAWTTSGLKMQWQFASALESACRDFNSRHRAWLDHLAKFPSRTMVVRHEDLLEDPAAILSSLITKFGLEHRNGVFSPITNHVGATDWDNCELLFTSQPFNASFYREKRFTSQLNSQLWDMVNSNIDWEVAGAFGYDRSEA